MLETDGNTEKESDGREHIFKKVYLFTVPDSTGVLPFSERSRGSKERQFLTEALASEVDGYKKVMSGEGAVKTILKLSCTIFIK